MRAALALALLACSPAKKPEAPKPKSPPLETASLAAITQGPGARWAIVGAPKTLFTGPLAPYANKLLPGLDKLKPRLGFDLRASSSAVMVGFAATTFYAARLPDGSPPSGALEAFEKRLLPPLERSSPRPDLVRVLGALPAGARGSAVGMWSSNGDVIAGESGRLGPAVASMALAAGKLSRDRSLSRDKTFGPLLTFVGNASIGVLARCPLAETLGATASDEKENVLFQECLGVAVAFRAAGPGKLAILARISGAWGKDAAVAEDELRATLARVAGSDLGRALGIKDALTEVKGAPHAVDATLIVDAAVFADGLGHVLSPQIGDATK